MIIVPTQWQQPNLFSHCLSHSLSELCAFRPLHIVSWVFFTPTPMSSHPTFVFASPWYIQLNKTIHICIQSAIDLSCTYNFETVLYWKSYAVRMNQVPWMFHRIHRAAASRRLYSHFADSSINHRVEPFYAMLDILYTQHQSILAKHKLLPRSNQFIVPTRLNCRPGKLRHKILIAKVCECLVFHWLCWLFITLELYTVLSRNDFRM